jgi:hypothetical protein
MMSVEKFQDSDADYRNCADCRKAGDRLRRGRSVCGGSSADG